MTIDDGFQPRAFLAPGRGKTVESGRERVHHGAVAPLAHGFGFFHLHSFQNAGKRHQRLEPRGRGLVAVPQRAMNLQQTLQHVLIDPDLRRAGRLCDRQVERQGTAAEPFRGQRARPRLQRVVPVRRAHPQVEVAPVDAPDLPTPPDFAVPALGAREAGHALERTGRFLRTVLCDCGLSGLGHVRFGGTREVVRRADEVRPAGGYL